MNVLRATLLGAVAAGAAMANAQLYTQPWSGTDLGYASQYDTATNGLGSFALAYDNFTLASSGTIGTVCWTGMFLNPPGNGTISSFVITFYNDNAGTVGTQAGQTTVVGNAGQTFNSTVGGVKVYDYQASVNSFAATAGTQYWLSIQAQMDYPPQWFWAEGTGGDGASLLDFYGSRLENSTDLAFTLKTANPVPEPFTMLLGAAALAAAATKKRRA